MAPCAPSSNLIKAGFRELQLEFRSMPSWSASLRQRALSMKLGVLELFRDGGADPKPRGPVRPSCTSMAGGSTGALHMHFAIWRGHIAAGVGVAAFVPDYRLAPEHPFPAAAEDVRACYFGLVEQGFSKIAIAGDSAGGTLAIGLLVHLARILLLAMKRWPVEWRSRR